MCDRSEIEVTRRCALTQHSCKTLCPSLADLKPPPPESYLHLLVVVVQMKVRGFTKPRSSKPPHSSIADLIAAEIEDS
jgi:hypothetical protein